MDRVIVSRPVMGFYTMQVCACMDATDAEILEVANSQNPSGTENGWTNVVRRAQDHPDHPARMVATFAPIPCADDPDRQHILITC